MVNLVRFGHIGTDWCSDEAGDVRDRRATRGRGGGRTGAAGAGCDRVAAAGHRSAGAHRGLGAVGPGVSREAAFSHVWGYTIIDDFTARDLQAKHKQWTIGKGLDTHCPMGPYAVSSDEIDDVTALQVQSFVNGEARQNAPVKELIF